MVLHCELRICFFPACVLPNITRKLLVPTVKTLALAITKSWYRPLLLDLLLASVFITQTRRRSPGYASIFLNAGAHIQHHYLFSSRHYLGASKNPQWFVNESDDPILAVYKVYDTVIRAIRSEFSDATVFISTGLSQRANVKTVHYYRPKNHRQLIDLLLSSATDLSIQERMSRDFLIACGDEGTARKVVDELEGIRLGNGDQLSG